MATTEKTQINVSGRATGFPVTESQAILILNWLESDGVWEALRDMFAPSPCYVTKTDPRKDAYSSESEHGGHGPFTDAGLVKCVECPTCGFTFDARHVDTGGDGPPTYTCDCGYSADVYF